MTSPYLIEGARSSEIVAGVVSGGLNTSHTMVVGVGVGVGAGAVLDAGPACAPRAAHGQAALAANVLEPRAYAWALAESQAARPEEHAKPAEAADAEAATDLGLDRPGTPPGR